MRNDLADAKAGCEKVTATAGKLQDDNKALASQLEAAKKAAIVERPARTDNEELLQLRPAYARARSEVDELKRVAARAELDRAERLAIAKRLSEEERANAALRDEIAALKQHSSVKSSAATVTVTAEPLKSQTVVAPAGSTVEPTKSAPPVQNFTPADGSTNAPVKPIQ